MFYHTHLGRCILLFSVLSLSRAFKSISSNVIDLNDILSSNYMPESLLILENVQDETKFFNSSINGRESADNDILDGSITKALGTMDFHRSMMNQYLCRSYVADQILSEMNLTKIRKRMADIPDEKILPFKAKLDIKNDLLYDEGSSSYKNWLTKSTTLEDIHRHYTQDNHNENSNIQDRDTEIHIEEETEDDVQVTEDKDLPDSFDIHVTNHALAVHPKKTVRMGGHQPPSGGYSSGSGGYYYPPSHGGYGQSGVGYEEPIHAGEHEQYYHSYPPKYQVQHHSSSEGYDKAQELADLFEIALTALAFLSFGMFIVHLFMSISMVINNPVTTTTTASSLFLAMSMNPTATADAYYSGESEEYSGSGVSYTGASGTGHDDSGSAEGTYKDTFKFRLKRDTTHPKNNNPILNELARRVLLSIDAALVVNSDGGECLRKALCETNKYSRSVTAFSKIILPVWSLGMSWLSGRLIRRGSPATSMIESLKASILGLGMANCEIIYQSCDLKKQKQVLREVLEKKTVESN